MTYEKAIRMLSVHSSTNGSGQCTDEEHKAAKEIAIKALEKQIPKAPETIIHSEDVKIGTVTMKAGTKIYKCFDCKSFVLRSHKYCPECGQALDWSDE